MNIPTLWTNIHSDAVRNPTITSYFVGLAFLMRDGDLRVPCSRYGTCTSDCAVVAWRVAEIIQEATGEPITAESLDGDMSMVVNDSDSVAVLLADYGNEDEREEWKEYARA